MEAAANDIAILIKGRRATRAAPENLLAELVGQVWEWTVPSDAVPGVKQRFILSSTLRRSDGVQVRVVHPSQPDPTAQPVEPNLEDVYLSYVHRSGN